MPQMTSYEPGVPSWVDIGVPDTAAAADFYSGLLGWDVPEGTAEMGFYRQAMLAGRPVAGIGPQQTPGIPPYWTSYVTVTSADEAAVTVAEAGGTVIVAPMDIPGAGRMAMFSDPTGAVFSVWQPGAHSGAGIVNEPGALAWNELITTDIDTAKTFYGAVFGWTARTTPAGPLPYTEFQVGGRSIAGGIPKGPFIPAEVPSHWGVYFAVADLDQALDSIKQLGGQVLMPGMESPAGRFAAAADNQGAMFNVIELVSRP